MKAKERYASLASTVIWIAVFYFYPPTRWDGGLEDESDWKSSLPHYDEKRSFQSEHYLPEDRNHMSPSSAPDCRMESCFDFSRCLGDPPYRHYVHPEVEGIIPRPGTVYSKLLRALRTSPFRTDNPDEACLFFLSLDTADRDKLSEGAFVGNLQERLNAAVAPSLWNGGLNHVIFNLYAGTYPNYDESELGFDPGRAILARASTAWSAYRREFDVSLPLFNASHPEKGRIPGTASGSAFPLRNRHLVGFRGKRYVYGIGSETRNSLYHLHNGDDVVMVTTCRHGKNWKDLQDERCDQDNEEYDRWDYATLLSNSTFCLVPRGRRLGSFRFMETLQAGCIPVVLSDGWVLPFQESIDWSQASVNVDESLLMQVPDILLSFSAERVFEMRQKTQFLYKEYFGSVETIVEKTLEIIHRRIHKSSPSPSLDHRPRELHLKSGKFTAILFASGPLSATRNMLHILSETKNIKRAILVNQAPVDQTLSWLSEMRKILRIPVEAFYLPTNHSRGEIPLSHDDEAIFSISDKTVLTTEEIEFAYGVFRHFPDRLVGYTPRTHYWADRQWTFSSKWTNDYSMVMANAAFYHASYHDLLLTESRKVAAEGLVLEGACQDILLNLVISREVEAPPIKLTQRRLMGSRVTDQMKHAQLRRCFSHVADRWGHNLPLYKSQVRFDPVLYKDSVSNTRKKYRKLEVAGP